MIISSTSLTTIPVEGVLRNLFGLRLFAMAGQLLALMVAEYGLHIALPWSAMLTVVAGLAVLNGLTWWRLRLASAVTALECFIQLLADMAGLTLLLYYSGGASNPFVSLYLIPIIIAATALPVSYAWLMTLLSIFAYSLLTQLFVPLSLPPGAVEFSLHLAGMWLNFIVSAVLIAYFIGKMAGSIRARDAALARVRESRLHDEQLLALGNLAAGAAHELSTPLATMSIVAEELQYTCAEDVEVQTSLVILRNQVAACKSILTRLTHINQQGRAEDSGVLPVDAWLAVLLNQWQLMRPQVQVSTRTLGVLPMPRLLNAPSLYQAMLSLCNNAADAADNVVEIELDWDANTVQIAVLDRGIGFSDPAQAKAIFFTTKTAQGGFGMGLFLANASIERHGGSVALLAREGGGARVLVRLPVCEVRV
jgi:two-component system sensor histidine kinase RegB